MVNLKFIPKHIKAKNELELEKMILRLQLRSGRRYELITIYPVKDGVVAWLHMEADIKQVLTDG